MLQIRETAAVWKVIRCHFKCDPPPPKSCRQSSVFLQAGFLGSVRRGTSSDLWPEACDGLCSDHFKFRRVIDASGLQRGKLQSVSVYFMSVHSKVIFDIIQTVQQGKIITGLKSFFLFLSLPLRVVNKTALWWRILTFALHVDEYI